MVNHLVLAICHFQFLLNKKKDDFFLNYDICWLIWHLFAGFKTVALYSGRQSKWFVKYVFSTKTDCENFN